MSLDGLARDVAELKASTSGRIEWATVTQASPVRIRLDGATDPLNMDVPSLVSVTVGQRVAVWTALPVRLILGPRPQLTGSVTMTLAATAINSVGITFPAGYFPASPKVFAQIVTASGSGFNWQVFGLVTASASSATAASISLISVSGKTPTAGWTVTFNWLATL
jgi:hypothetical protein